MQNIYNVSSKFIFYVCRGTFSLWVTGWTHVCPEALVSAVQKGAAWDSFESSSDNCLKIGKQTQVYVLDRSLHLCMWLLLLSIEPFEANLQTSWPFTSEYFRIWWHSLANHSAISQFWKSNIDILPLDSIKSTFKFSWLFHCRPSEKLKLNLFLFQPMIDPARNSQLKR